MPETSTSLRQLIEGRYDERARTLTLDPSSFGDQVASLLVTLNVEQIALTGVTLDPPKGTSPVPATSSLSGSAALWGAVGARLELAIAPGDRGVARITATATIPSITLPSLARFVLPMSPDAAMGLDSIVFSDGLVTAAAPDGTLIYRATLADGWSPFGIDQVHLEGLVFRVAALNDPEWGSAVKVLFTAELIVGSTRIPVELDMPVGAGGWTIRIVPPGVTLHALDDITQLLGGPSYRSALPRKLVEMSAVQLRSLTLRFDPAGPSWTAIDMHLATASAWPIADHLQIEQVGLLLSVRPASSPMVNALVYGSLTVGALELMASIPIPLFGSIHITGRTNRPLPGLGALARLVDAPFAGSLPDGIANLGSLRISEVSLDYDLDSSAITSLGLAVSSAGPWTLIPKYLSLDDLSFQIKATRPAGAWIIQGAASGTILVAGVRVGVGVEGTAGAWSVALTEPLLLPGIGDLVSLVGGLDPSKVLPGGMDSGVGALTVDAFCMSFGGASNTLQDLTLSFRTSNPWRFWDPYFVLEDLEVSIAVTNPSGARALDASVRGVVAVCGVAIELSAAHPPAGMSWTFTGGLAPHQELDAGDFIGYLLDKFGLRAPDAVASVALDDLSVTFITGTRAFMYHSVGSFEAAGQIVSVALDFTVSPKGPGGFRLDVVGALTISSASFRVTFDETPGKARLTAQWSDAARPIGFADIAGAFGFVPPDMPEGLDLSLTEIDFSYELTSGRLVLGARSLHYGRLLFVTEVVEDRRVYLLDLEVPLRLDFSELPVAGPHLPGSLDLGVEAAEITYASAALGADEVAAINEAVAELGAAPLSPAALSRGMSLSAVLRIGGAQRAIVLPLGRAGQPPSARTQEPALAASAALGAPPAAPAAYQGSAKWVQIGKSFGPVQIDRVGMQYQDGVLLFLLDASLGLSVLALSLDGLAVGSPLTSFSPRGHLRGISVSFSSGPITIGGGLLMVPQDRLPGGVEYEYLGEVVIGAEQFMIAAVASYAKVGRHPSFFVFGQVTGAFGGPPAFFVTGFMAGFGYNSRLHVPSRDQVYLFPFIAGLDDPSVFGTNLTPLGVMNVLSGSGGAPTVWVEPALGQDWMAAGIRFRSFELVLGRAMLIATFGRELEIALLGLASMSLPQGLPAPYAYVELQLEAALKPGEGYFGAAASLTPSSFLLTRGCHLTGGFAFCIWFGTNPNAGNFVVTIGGYHPAFQPPSFYPRVAPVGFNWQDSGRVTIKGGAYFALTPSAVMAGAGLEALFHSGGLHAWFKAWADLLIAWKPFRFEASIGVSVGASYRMKLLFTTMTISVELGATLDLWGPPTGGVVRVHWHIISFSVRFGSREAALQPKRLDWEGFSTLLPQRREQGSDQQAPAVLGVQVHRGLTRQDSASKAWVVRSEELVFRTYTAVPSSDIQYTGQRALAAAPGGIDIRPMELTNVRSVHAVAVTDATTGEEVDLSAWSPATQEANLPEALWGRPLAGARPAAAANTLPAHTGVRFTAPPARVGPSPGPMDVGSITEDLPGGPMPLSPESRADPIPAPVVDAGSVAEIQAAFTAHLDRVRDNQRRLVAELAAFEAQPATTGITAKLGASAGTSFAEPPMRSAA